MPRPPITDAQRKTQRRNIRRAASEIYRDAGVHGVSVRAIAERAGVSTGTLYTYFDNLQDLLRSLWLEPVTQANAELERVADKHSDPVDRIVALLESYAEFAADNPDVFRGVLLFVRPSSLPEPDPEPFEDLPLYRLLREAVIEGQESGSVRPEAPDTLVHLLWSGTHGALALPVHLERHVRIEQLDLARAMIPALIRSIEP